MGSDTVTVIQLQEDLFESRQIYTSRIEKLMSAVEVNETQFNTCKKAFTANLELDGKLANVYLQMV